MTASPSSFLNDLRRIVADHYAKVSTPLLLSNLGLDLREKGLWPADEYANMSLRQVIESVDDEDLQVLRDPDAPAFIAVASASAKGLVERVIEWRKKANAIDLEALPRPVVLAFCVRQQPGLPIYLTRTAPFRYQTDAPPLENQSDFFVIEEKYRRPGLNFEVSKLSPKTRFALAVQIGAWAMDAGVDIGIFNKQEACGPNALERLLSAQLPGVAEQMRIPGDIALILSQHE